MMSPVFSLNPARVLPSTPTDADAVLSVIENSMGVFIELSSGSSIFSSEEHEAAKRVAAMLNGKMYFFIIVVIFSLLVIV